MAKPKLGSGKRFAAVKASVKKGLKPSALNKGQSKDQAAAAIAASIGRKKYGAKRMASLAVAGKHKK